MVTGGQFLSTFGSCSQASPRGMALAVVGMQGRTNFADTQQPYVFSVFDATTDT
jgi:hypothetical protein